VNLEVWQVAIAALITVCGSVLAARYAGKSSVKVKQLDVDGQAYLRAEGITANLIKQLTETVERVQQDREDDKREYEAELAKRDLRLDAFEKQLQQVSNRNRVLETFVYIMLAILRRHDLIGEINPQDVPDGIRV
jgi:hypothetical protein